MPDCVWSNIKKTFPRITNLPSLLPLSSASDEMGWQECFKDTALLLVFSSMRVPPARLSEHAVWPGDRAVLLPPGGGRAALQPLPAWALWVSPLPPLSLQWPHGAVRPSDGGVPLLPRVYRWKPLWKVSIELQRCKAPPDTGGLQNACVAGGLQFINDLNRKRAPKPGWNWAWLLNVRYLFLRAKHVGMCMQCQWVDSRQGMHPGLQWATCKKALETWTPWHHVQGDTHKALCVG